MRKALLLPFVLALACFGQSQYVQTTTSNGVITFTNVSGQAIIGAVGTIYFDGKPTGTNNLMYDHFFDADGWPAGGVHSDFDTKNQPTDTPMNYTVTLTYIQFADGSSWGDKTTAANMFTHRTMAGTVLQTLDAVSGDNSQFVAALNVKQTDPDMDKSYARYRWLNTNVGTAEAITQVKTRYATGQARINSGKF